MSFRLKPRLFFKSVMIPAASLKEKGLKYLDIRQPPD